jgi:NAD(P)-dependent dehydrogenase (short-subunit alcohol dehydrogenase family)
VIGRSVPPFDDKVVLITGTARGCGAVLAEAFAKTGATVVGCDVDTEAGEAVADKIRASGGRIDFSSVDVSREDEVEALVAGTLEAHGRLNCAINNAGTEELSEIADGTESGFDELIATDLKGLSLEEQHVPEETLLQCFPVGGMGRPEELVAAAMYLCSDEARFCTGTTLVLGRGLHGRVAHRPPKLLS